MSFAANNILLFITAFLLALVTGLFFNWSNTIMPGLAKLPDAAFITAMQSLNRTIQNPLFLIAFMGAAVLLPVCCWRQYGGAGNLKFYLLLAAGVLYLGGVIAVTMAGNVPLNETLDKFNIQNANAADIASQRKIFESKWNGLNTIRTISAIGSLLLVLCACVFKETE
jgi:uncharacterized membrane protein